MSLPVFLTAAGDLDGLGPGDSYALTGPEARHAVGAMRIRPGEQVQVVDGAGVRLTGQVTAVDGGARLDLDVQSVERERAPGCRLVLVQALAKGGRDELAIEAGTEVGMDAVVPWQSARSVSRWRGPKAARGVARWCQVVQAATKQSRRAYLPAVADLVDGEHVQTTVRSAVASGGVVLVAHESATTPISQVQIAPEAPEVLVVVGPEGGLTDDEVRGLSDAGAQVVRLGPHVLRTSTAGPVALTLVAHALRRE
ncbi:16S rRNA (uracil(1498)-N(3))-methyltransferase [Ruania albidiflava]|uniref:16S rRNA (uracil(1498)-N(3))-methyltransferase n=1 Tax=Ruania albidiflava TaxID=366586 RepID=UPI0023F0526B|nr:16S rRNA (uracil(1498)-N(3))-methyltransferase [Ruania albidiflava]